ncbi:MAG TPA: DUF4194 domain-containing protein [Actinomycetales bacterium]|jgi:hypothetical protein
MNEPSVHAPDAGQSTEQAAEREPAYDADDRSFISTGQAWEDEDELGGHAGPLFDGDTGQLPENVRTLLLTLLRKRYISADANPREWQLLANNEPAIRTRMHDLFLDLVVNRDYEVAFKQQVSRDSGDDKFPTLLYDKAYSREETIVLVLLRRELRARQQAGQDNAFIDRVDLLEEIERHRPESATNHVENARAAAKAVENLITMDLLLKTEQPHRYRIPSVLEVLLPKRKLDELYAWLKAQNAPEQNSAPTSDVNVEQDGPAFDFDGDDLTDGTHNTPEDAA